MINKSKNPDMVYGAGLPRRVVLSLILLCLSWRLGVPIQLMGTDLGRHIKNGELILQGTWDVLYKNYYSYTNPEYPFINHHWLFGVFCFLLWHSFGFSGISLFFVAVRLAAFWIFFRLAERFSSFSVACAFGLLSFPLIATRLDIRPELFSTLFCGLFWWFLDSYNRGRITPRRLKIWLPVIQLIWVNTHIFFMMGPVLTVLFWAQAKIEKREQESKHLKQTIWLVMAACLLNPSGIKGALLPLSLFHGFHTVLVENIPIFASYNYIPHGLWRWFMVSLILLLLCWTYFLQYQQIKQNMAGLALVILLSLSALGANRLMTLFGHFWIPLISCAFAGWMPSLGPSVRKAAVPGLMALGILAALTVGFDGRQKPEFGLAPGVNDSIEFFKQNRISGPIFNNYDIGGYLIFHLSPAYKLFVDNRAEAFPKNFFDHVLNPAEDNNRNWFKLDERYHFNVIFFHLYWFNDYEERFIFNRIQDPHWALVFSENDVFIFARRNPQNMNLIQRYECPTDKIMKRLEGLGFKKGGSR
jgi:hypothetical protein